MKKYDKIFILVDNPNSDTTLKVTDLEYKEPEFYVEEQQNVIVLTESELINMLNEWSFEAVTPEEYIKRRLEFYNF